MRKALVSFGTGDAAKPLAVAMPTYERYARRHGYDLIIPDSPFCYGRPPAWGKVPLLQHVLKTHDFVLWIDADALIVDDNVDIEAVIPTDAYQAFAIVRDPASNEQGSPCTGVWALRSSERTQRLLAEGWAQDDLVDARWWEQGALHRLLGWTMDGKQHASVWDAGIYHLPIEWDAVPKFIGYSPGTDPALRRGYDASAPL
jgi:hypothetical protein